LLLEHSTLTNEVARLRRLQRAHERNENMLTNTRRRSEQDIDRLQDEITHLERAVERVDDPSGDKFKITIGTTVYTSRTDAAHALEQWAQTSGLQYASVYQGHDY